MTAFTQHEPESGWRPQRRETAIRLYLAGAEGDAAELVGTRVLGAPLELSLVPVTEWIGPEDLADSMVAVVQVDPDSPASIRRFEKLAAHTSTPLIAASYDPPLSLVRALLRNGAADVIQLPLDPAELETCLSQLDTRNAGPTKVAPVAAGKVVAFVKTGGGTGATALLCQTAARFAAEEASRGRGACLLDFDLQFGDAAFQLGLQPSLSMMDLLQAGNRLDGDLVRATSAVHSSGLHVVAAPSEMMPLEGLSSDDFLQIVDAAARSFGTAFIELPTNWTNWSMSLLARSDLIVLAIELTVASIHRARRQLDLLRSQGLDDLNIRIVVNKFDKSQLRLISRSDVRAALGQDIAITVADDPSVMNAATERGVTIEQVKRRSAVAKDIDHLDSAIAAILGLER